MKRCKSNLGGALIITLGIMLMLTIAALMAVHRAETDIDLSFNQLHYDQAFYVAEAGLRQAFDDLNVDNTTSTGYTDVTFEEGTYWVIIEHLDTGDPGGVADTVEIRSTAQVQQACANVRAVIVPELLNPWDFAVYGDEFISMTNNVSTGSYDSDLGDFATTYQPLDGDVASNGTVLLDNSAMVGGEASSALSPGVTVCPTCTVSEGTNDGVDSASIEPIPQEDIDDALLNNINATGISGVYDYDGPPDYRLTLGNSMIARLAAGVYYFEDIFMEENSILYVDSNVTIYIMDTLSLDNNTSLNPDQDAADLKILSTGTVETVGNDVDIHASFYGPDADLYLANSCEWFGSIIANSVTLDNTASIYYDLALAQEPLWTTGRMLMIAWEEE